MSLEWFRFNWNMHDDFDEYYSNQRQVVWEPRHLLEAINKGLEMQIQYITNIEIYEDYYNKCTVIDIIINERKYLVKKLVSPDFNLEKIIESKIKDQFAMLNPIVKIKVE